VWFARLTTNEDGKLTTNGKSGRSGSRRIDMTTPRVRHGRLDEGVPAVLPAELVSVLAEGGGVRIERVVSRGHASAEGAWYQQSEDEFVLLVSGAARLEFEEFDLELMPGGWVELPAGVRHRVGWTAEGRDTIWLAVFRPASGG
jgi:cupin 2 domain-containing protein